MGETFENQLLKVSGKIRRIDVCDHFKKRHSGLLHYWNCAEELHRAALVISNSDQILNRVFAMLAGLSIELLLKGLLLGLQEKVPTHHKLIVLSELAGISIDVNDRTILGALTIYVMWASKYPAPKDEVALHKAQEVFDSQRRQSGSLDHLSIPEKEINSENYLRLWKLFCGYYWKVDNVVLESAEMGPF